MRPHLAKILLFAIIPSIVMPSFAQNLPIHPKKVKEVFERVSNIRGLKAKALIDLGVRSKDEVKRHVIKRFKEEYPSRELELERRSLVALGLLKEDFPYRDFLVSFLTSQIAGYYDPSDKTMYLAEWLRGELQIPTLAHEFTHLLQDQNFNLKSFIKREKENDDLVSAKASLLEGDATYTMMEYMFEGSGIAKRDEISMKKMITAQMQDLSAFGLKNDTPSFFVEALIFPYLKGFDFVGYLKNKGGWEAVNKSFTDIPKSTEQIIHPEKYPSEEPVQVNFIDHKMTKAGCKVERKNVLGEFFIYLMLKNYLEEGEAKIASEGWGGDSYALCSKGSLKRDPLVFYGVWDTKDDAEQFFRAYSRLLAKKYDTVSFVKDSFIVKGSKGDDFGVLLKNEGNVVFFAEGFDKNSIRYFEGPAIRDLVTKEKIKNDGGLR